MEPSQSDVPKLNTGPPALDESTLLKWCEAAFELAPVSVVLHRGGLIRYANAAARTLVGAVRQDQLIGRPMLDFIHPEMHPLVLERMHGMAERFEAVPPVDEKLVKLDGQTTEAEVTSWVISSRPEPFILVMLHDIAKRLQADEALRDSEERFRNLFEDAPIAYHEIDVNGVVQRVNRAECELLGFRPEELLGVPVWEQVVDDQRELSRERVAAKLTGRERLAPFERYYAGREGARLRLEVHENLIRDEHGKVVGIRSAMLDVSEKRRAEERLEAFSQQLQKSNAELSQALKAAREAAATPSP